VDYVVQTNLVGTVNCLQVAARSGADVVFLSTSRVYPVAALNEVCVEEDETRFRLAERQTLPGVSVHGVAEDFPLDGVRSLYGATKLASELLIHELADLYGLRFVIDRCGVITGPWQMAKLDQGVFALWVAHHHFGKPLSYIGWGATGKQVRDLLHVDDLGDLLLLQLARLPELTGSTFNVGGGVEGSLSLLETTELCRELSGTEIPIGQVPESRPGDLRMYVSDNRRVTQATGWQPRRTPRQTLGDILEWVREHGDAVAHLWQ
jgi:CDP-paratose 2-epimerase